jgi:hypothetical protein
LFSERKTVETAEKREKGERESIYSVDSSREEECVVDFSSLEEKRAKKKDLPLKM